ncbi:MAG: DNA gyrase C-terminal beta-propeller domain-containing protein, partial [Thermostichales cyanobacterium SZTDM-1c_bins_54]
SRRERILQIIKEELLELKARFHNPRRSRIQLQETDLETEDLIENREIVLFLTEQGYIKRLDVEEFQVQRRATRGKSGTRMKEEDAVAQFLACRSHDTILLFSNRGLVYSLRGFEIPPGSRTARGTALVQLLSLEGNEKITSVIPISEFCEDEYLVMLTEGGYIKKTALSAFANIRSSGLIAISLEEGDHLAWVRRARETDDVLIATRQGMGIRFHADHQQLRPLGRATRGVRAITLNPGDQPVSMDIIPANAKDGFILLTTVQGYGKLTPVEAMRAQNRGGKGVIACKLRQDEREGGDELVALRIVQSSDEIMLVTSRGIVIRQVVQAISSQSRMGMGVRLQRLDEDDRIVAVTVVPPSEQGDPEESVEEKEGD